MDNNARATETNNAHEIDSGVGIISNLKYVVYESICMDNNRNYSDVVFRHTFNNNKIEMK